MKKKFLVWAYFAKNIGDDLFLKVLFDRYPNVQWDLLTANRNYNEIFKDYSNVKITYLYRDVKLGNLSFNPFFKMNELLLNYNKYDGLLFIGGSIFMQSPAWRLKKKEREYLINKFKTLNKKVFVLGANFGPYKDKYFEQEYRETFLNIDDICFRDQYSYNLFEDLDNVRVAPDIVFNLGFKDFIPKDKAVGFSLISLEHREGLSEYNSCYSQKVTEMIESFYHLGYKINLFSFCENEGDLEYISKLKNSIKDEYKHAIQIINYEGNINKFLDEFKRCALIIGTRFHSIILGLLYNQAVFPLIYSNKTLNVLKDLGMEKVSCNIKEIEKLDVKKNIKIAFENKLNNNHVFLESKRHFERLDIYIEEIEKEKIKVM